MRTPRAAAPVPSRSVGPPSTAHVEHAEGALGRVFEADRAGGEVGIHRRPVPRLDRAVDGDDAFQLQPFQHRQRRAVGIGDDLGHAVMVAQIDEQHPAMIALAMDPAGQAHGLADIGSPQRGAGV